MIDTKSEGLVVKQIQDNEVIFNNHLKWLESISPLTNIDVDVLDLSLKFNMLKEQIDVHIKKLRSTRELLKYTPYIKIDYLNELSETINLIDKLKNIHKEIRRVQKLVVSK
jgi:hypothetical protein